MGEKTPHPIGDFPVAVEAFDVDELAEVVSRRTDLSEHVCRELLMNGWSFKQEIGKPDRWEKVF